MRLFLAVLPDEQARDALVEVQNRMWEAGLRGNYDIRDNLHITLAYIGEYPDPDGILDLLEEIQRDRFVLVLQGIGVFRKLYWCGVRENDALQALTADIRHRLSDAGIPYDRKKFVPHITLLRKAWSEAGDPYPEIDVPEVSWEAARISLMKSERMKQGMVYTEIGSIPLI
ncbi:MAG: RNA 2',3'-cyclic phosphodiesterase [Solobacterium sp.]|nr:RNA 2',3'-cyclic phosphodiesterase [Solobacterium sp.]